MKVGIPRNYHPKVHTKRVSVFYPSDPYRYRLSVKERAFLHQAQAINKHF